MVCDVCRSKKHLQNTEMLQAALAEEEPSRAKSQLWLPTAMRPIQGRRLCLTPLQLKQQSCYSVHTGETSEASSMDECVQTKEEAAVARPASSVSSQDASPKVFGYKSASDAEGSDSSDECLDEDEMLSRMVHAQMQVGSGHSKAQKRPTMSARRSDESLPASRAAQDRTLITGTCLHQQDLHQAGIVSMVRPCMRRRVRQRLLSPPPMAALPASIMKSQSQLAKQTLESRTGRSQARRDVARNIRKESISTHP